MSQRAYYSINHYLPQHRNSAEVKLGLLDLGCKNPGYYKVAAKRGSVALYYHLVLSSFLLSRFDSHK